MSRSRRRRAKAGPDASDDFQHSSRHVDLESLLADHMIGEAAAEVTAEWTPARRGDSPHGSPGATR